MMRRWITFALCSVLIGCATDASREENDDEQQFKWDNIAWQLEHFIGPNGETTSVKDGTIIDALFTKGQLSGSGGCNRYFGKFEISEESKLMVSPVGSTMMACSEIINEQERRYFDSLAKVGGYRYDEEARLLTLSDQEGNSLLVFKTKTQPTLEKNQWQVSGINNGKGGIVSDKNTALANAYFADGTVQGKAGCNRYSAAYTKQDEELRIDSAQTTRMFCAEDGVMELEANFLNVMARVVRYEIDGDRLKLLDKDGALLIGFVRK
ncbi:META domain-containing protein [Methylotuvimicrobium sp. KM2]|uniref:META domain-containing protein n=1 Tax=Methylotuvimicrobium sp. KM2 TaxID=3133976 RepID=UPI003101ADB9